ncbi:musculoskeletal embryonic nuclear protein 1a [Salvelinus sp. IW2-2015]|uniref:musculoskeletal embryonic nuclear protein 1a n=1 Tax=Salvelinus sp. IW2-2015 TaxID=2691554 RepID=UPI000CDF9B3E|nr:musculoskeletal embryonic nuclear protein 1 [Salvelinus alpinus]
MSQPEEGEEGQLKRPEVCEEDLIGAKDKLSAKGKLKGKTIEVMDECERAGKVAPSVFSGVRSGRETAFNKSQARQIKK